jgi:hypothetical protein
MPLGLDSIEDQECTNQDYEAVLDDPLPAHRGSALKPYLADAPNVDATSSAVHGPHRRPPQRHRTGGRVYGRRCAPIF